METSLSGHAVLNITIQISTSHVCHKQITQLYELQALMIFILQENGVLLYNGDVIGTEKEHLAVDLFSGRIRISYDAGSFPGSTLYSDQLINDDNFHTVS